MFTIIIMDFLSARHTFTSKHSTFTTMTATCYQMFYSLAERTVLDYVSINGIHPGPPSPLIM